MKYPVWIKLKENEKILKAIDYLGMSDCYDCRDEKGKRELIDGRTPCLYSRDKETWLTFDELDELDNPKVEYPEGSSIYYIDKHLSKVFDEVFIKSICLGPSNLPKIQKNDKGIWRRIKYVSKNKTK